MKYVLFYESAPDVLERAPLHQAAHGAFWREFARGGTLLLLGPFERPADGAMSVFTTREAAEAALPLDTDEPRTFRSWDLPVLLWP